MLVGKKHYRTIWLDEVHPVVHIIDQRHLPHRFVIEDLYTVDHVAVAIEDMLVRGAGLIGITAAYGMYFAALTLPPGDPGNHMEMAAAKLKATRPTAVNLAWAVDRQLEAIRRGKTKEEKIIIALQTAEDIIKEDMDSCRKIGHHGMSIIKAISQRKNGAPVNILTHCNAGWLAFADYGTATAPIYMAAENGIDLHVWVDETRPRNQGASLTAWELAEQGIPHTVIPDNTGGHLMQHGMVDMAIVGTDRTTSTGDVANKIGTYLKALAAKDNKVPFYVALPSSSFDWNLRDGIKEIPIEQRNSREVRYISGLDEKDNSVKEILIVPESSNAANYGFDVTPARLVTGLITERGICEANEESIYHLFPEKRLLL
jgi:methylthioribose-1-phosphate isomerase